MSDSKVIFKQLCFEVTRRCNMACEHCMRGDAQDLAISKEVIDKCLDRVAGVHSIILTGGEPFLEPDIIDYLFDGIIRRKIKIYGFSCMTNGSIRNEQIAKAWNRLADYIASIYEPTEDTEADRKHLRAIGQIVVSYDKYHQLDCDPLDTVKWYRQYLNNHCIALRETFKKEDTIHMLGRAVGNEKIMDSGAVDYVVCPHKLSLVPKTNVVETTVQIGCSGIITTGEDSSYEQQDKCNYGNILTESLFDIIQKALVTELFTQYEAGVYNNLYTQVQTGAVDIEQGNALLSYFDAIYTARKVCQKIYPWMQYDELVQAVYDDMNVQMRKTEDSPYIVTIYPLEEYKRTIRASQRRLTAIKLAALIKDPLPYFANQSELEHDVVKIPVKIWEKCSGR